MNFVENFLFRGLSGGGGSGGESGAAESRVLATLLTEMDGIGSDGSGEGDCGVIVLAATNRLDCIDPALLRKVFLLMTHGLVLFIILCRGDSTKSCMLVLQITLRGYLCWTILQNDFILVTTLNTKLRCPWKKYLP